MTNSPTSSSVEFPACVYFQSHISDARQELETLSTMLQDFITFPTEILKKNILSLSEELKKQGDRKHFLEFQEKEIELLEIWFSQNDVLIYPEFSVHETGRVSIFEGLDFSDSPIPQPYFPHMIRSVHGELKLPAKIEVIPFLEFVDNLVTSAENLTMSSLKNSYVLYHEGLGVLHLPQLADAESIFTRASQVKLPSITQFKNQFTAKNATLFEAPLLREVRNFVAERVEERLQNGYSFTRPKHSFPHRFPKFSCCGIRCVCCYCGN
jgi:hypothetical protein